MDIYVENLCKSFGDKVIFEGLNHRFAEHKTTCLMAPSGCGKTTLLECMMGIVKSYKGAVRGVPHTISAVFQEDRLCPGFSAYTNVRVVSDNTITKDIIESHFAKAGLLGSMNIPVEELSGGMKRRAAIIRAMLAKSEAVFMDEPFKGMDEETKLNMISYLKEHRDNRTIIIVTHDENEVTLLDAELYRMPYKEELKE